MAIESRDTLYNINCAKMFKFHLAHLSKYIFVCVDQLTISETTQLLVKRA